ncbi:MAG: hypothetical protein IE917_15830 [Betaproteobacteria bacterium]|nr:hypothetical protein [Betaproteobacteria bacterium]
MSSHALRLGSTLAVIGAICAVPSAGFAQDTTGVAPLAAVDTNPACMTGTFRNAPQVSQAERGQPFRIVVAAKDAAALTERGFVLTDCTIANLATAQSRNGWRDYVCELSAFGNEAVQRQFEAALGERPAVLCGSAELAIGAWQRGKSAQ